jgi:hypothetical protein
MSVWFRRWAVGAGAVLALIVAQMAVGAVPAFASGMTVYVTNMTLHVDAWPGEVDHVDISPYVENNTLKAYEVKVSAPATPPVPGSKCVLAAPDLIRCDPSVTSLNVKLDDGPDTLGVRGTLPGAIDLGDGDDVLEYTDGANHIYGGLGNDKIYAGGGADVIMGGDGADLMKGEGGKDTVSYADHAFTVWADADGAVGDDGSAGEMDTIGKDVEKIVGGRGADFIQGGESDDEFYGGDGDDTMTGGGGADRMFGEAGFDLLYGDGGTRDATIDVCLVGPDGGATFDCEVRE